MSKRGTGRVVFGIGFVVLLLDGGAAIWLGQVSGRTAIVVVGVLLLLASAILVVAWKRWMDALDAVDDLRRDLKEEIVRLRKVADQARSGRRPE
jgi:membrane protein implicated in regulation of membrane protease activity